MLTRLARHWWRYAPRGVEAILFGIAAFGRPNLTIAVLIVRFGAYALVDGIFLIISALAGWSQIEDSWLILLEGLIGAAIGALTFHSPAITGLSPCSFILRRGALPRGSWRRRIPAATERHPVDRARNGADMIPRPGRSD